MKRPQYILQTILLMTLPLLFAACEKEIRLDMDGYKPRIVMNGIISPDSLIEIRVSKSFLYTDTFTEKSRLGNATLTLYINGEEREKMVKIGTESNTNQDRLGFQYTALMTLFRSTVRPKTGDRIRIEASAEGFNTAWAETTIPLPPQINRIDTATFFTAQRIMEEINNEYYPGYGVGTLYPDSIRAEELYRNLRIRASITTPPSKLSQYFMLRLRSCNDRIPDHPDMNGYFLGLYTNDDPIFKESYRSSLLEDLLTEGPSYEGVKYFDSAIFSDKLFRNNSYTLDFSITDYYPILTTYEKTGETTEWGYPVYIPVKTEVLNPPLEVQFTLISPELYPYYRKGRYDPHSDEESFRQISEPEMTYGNVHNGIGVVGAVSTATAHIHLPPFSGGGNRVPRR
jgi:hypothetical protein